MNLEHLPTVHWPLPTRSANSCLFLAYIVAIFVMPVDYGFPAQVPTEARATS